MAGRCRHSAKILACGGTARDEDRVTDEDDRENILRSIADVGARTRAPEGAGEDAGELGWTEIAAVAEGLAFGPRALRAATDKVTERYDLGPRGAWILNVISHGIAYPIELATVFRVGRSLITAELGRLTDAGLISASPGKDDRRRTELTLTALGREVSEEIRRDLMNEIRRRLAGYSAADARLIGRMLRALSRDPDADS